MMNGAGASVPTEFINLVSSEANEISTKEDKKTISPEHVMNALSVSNPCPSHMAFLSSSFLYSRLYREVRRVFSADLIYPN
eukprot:1181510-Prorocentrum_minimum.AAC.6